jgi:hypothetical protein
MAKKSVFAGVLFSSSKRAPAILDFATKDKKGYQKKCHYLFVCRKYLADEDSAALLNVDFKR